jgi:hypothetical protein
MKTSQFRALLREEIRKVMRENKRKSLREARIVIDDESMYEELYTYFNGDATLADRWSELFSDLPDFGNKPKMIAAANKFADSEGLGWKVVGIKAIDPDDGFVTWILEK